MKIVRFKKGKKNLYELEFDNGIIIKLYDDVIVKYNLLANKKLDDSKLEEINAYNDSLNAYYECIKKINTKLRSELELRNLLEKNGYNNEIIDKTIKKLNKDGYLNRELYIKSYINDNFLFNNDGPEKIKRNLKKLGFNSEEIDIYLTQDFREKAIKLIDKKIKINKKLSNYMLKQSINNYLINLGYPKTLYIDYLENINTNDLSILKKEASLLINKYQKKYEKERLYYFIKDKLYKKGYNSEVIEEVLNELL